MVKEASFHFEENVLNVLRINGEEIRLRRLSCQPVTCRSCCCGCCCSCCSEARKRSRPKSSQQVTKETSDFKTDGIRTEHKRRVRSPPPSPPPHFFLFFYISRLVCFAFFCLFHFFLSRLLSACLALFLSSSDFF